VIAYGRGGALETVTDGVSGLFFKEQSVDSLLKAVDRFESKTWDPKSVSDSVEGFASQHFKSKLRHFLEEAWKAHRGMLA
jgi:hypothetical protein